MEFLIDDFLYKNITCIITSVLFRKVRCPFNDGNMIFVIVVPGCE